MTVITFVQNNSIHYHTPSIRREGKWYRLVNGNEVPEQEFKQMFPLDHSGKLKTFRDYPKGANPDKTKIV